MHNHKLYFTFTFLVLTMMSSIVNAQLKVNRIYSADDVQQWNVSVLDEVLTRQNSCTVTLTDFYFPEIKDGNFLVSLSVKFQQYPIGGGEPITKQEMRLLFKDVIQNIKKGEPIKMTLNDKLLGGSVLLNEVNNVNVQVRMVKVKDNYKEFMQMAEPILGVGITQQPVFAMIDNFLDKQTTDDKEKLLFSADFWTPANVFEYQKLRESSEMALLQNNQPYAIILNSATAASDGSILDKLGMVANKTTKFVMGKRFIPPTTAKFSGLVRLYFTKDATPVLPSALEDNLRDLDNRINSPAPPNEGVLQNDINNAANMAAVFKKSNSIDNQTMFSINEYLKLSKIFTSTLSSQNNSNWANQFENWRTYFDTKGAAVGAQVIGITNIYDNNRIAKIYLPYALPDDMIMSFYLWQVSMHKTLKAQNKINLSEPLPKISETPATNE